MTEKLLAYCRRRATRHGLALVSERHLVRDLECSSDIVAAALKDLQLQGEIEVLTPLPYVVLRLRKWSGSNPSRGRKAQQISRSERSLHIEVPVSSKAAAAATHTEVGGAGEGGTLLDEVLRSLGPEADRSELRGIIASHSPALIRRCLRRVQATAQIRVSRTALFRALLVKLSR